MSDQANMQTTVANTTAAASDEAAVKFFATKAEAEAAKPAAPSKKKLYEVAKGGASRWCWANGYDHALASAARADGYTASHGAAKAAPPTKESTAAFLDAMSDSDRAAFLAKYMPAPTAPKGRGK